MPSMLYDPRLRPLLTSIKAFIREELPAKDAIQEDDIVEQLFFDTALFEDWLLVPGDPRNQPDRATEQTYLLPRFKKLKDALSDVVDFNLKGMKEVGEDTSQYGNPEIIVNKLLEYVIFWKQWYYDLKYQEDLDAFYENRGINEQIYVTSNYANDFNAISGGYEDDDIPTKLS